MLENAGIRKFFSGPESFTPDTQYLLGETSEVKNLYTCCGFNSIGIASSGGAGRVTAEWMINGHVNEDLFSLDIKRFQKFHSSKKFIMDRVTETLGDLYGMHWPYKQHETSRNEKLLPYHEELKKAGACFGVTGGFERPMWYSLNGEEPKYEYSFNYQNWYPSTKHETINARMNVGLFDFSTFSKFDLKGEKVHSDLQKICTANIKNEIGKSTYTHMLNEDGGIETDLTVVCIDKNYFRIVSSAATRERDKFHIFKYLSEDVKFSDVTEEICCLGLFGPKSRNMIQKISSDDFSSENFKFGTGKNINIHDIKVWAQRISYVGELGFELYVNKKDALDLYKILTSEGKNFDLSHCGMHAMDIMRMESGFLHWGHDISPEENQYQAGLSFTISNKKEIDFIGKQALEKIKKEKIINAVSPKKDVDEFHPMNVGNLSSGHNALVPCTPLGCLYLIKKVEKNLSGKHAVIIGRSNLNGKPMAQLLLKENCTVTIVHSKTKNLKQECLKADILVAAVGVAKLVKEDWVKKNSIVIDVGINKLGDKIVGDVDFDAVKDKSKAITPVPGGVGPMTIACLLKNPWIVLKLVRL